jgi:hypothetical protein
MADYELIREYEGGKEPSAALVAVEQSRAVAEVQSAIFAARMSPRDQNAAYSRIIKACQRKRLAECAMYAYPRGGQTVTGPSIRLAEALAQNWGNMQSGFVELEQRNGESQVLAYAWDLETNYRTEKRFRVKHERHTRDGKKRLTDPRDIYELVANQASRRIRSCILGVIPGDIIESAIEECEKTMRGDGKEPLADRVRKMVAAFEAIGVTGEMIKTRLGHNLDATTEIELVNLRKIYTSLKDGMGEVDQWFPRAVDQSKTKAERVMDKIKKGGGEEPEVPQTDLAGDPQ